MTRRHLLFGDAIKFWDFQMRDAIFQCHRYQGNFPGRIFKLSKSKKANAVKPDLPQVLKNMKDRIQ